MTIRPRRSVLYMPGSNTRAMEKAKTLPIDAVILDLEDSVAPDAKAEARKLVGEAVTAGGYGRREVFVRVNGLDTPWFADDLEAAIACAPDVILVPKISTPQELLQIGQRLLDRKADPRIRIWAMIETPLAIFDIRALAAVAADPETRLGGFVMGTNDLAKETRVRLVPGRAPMTGWLANCVLAAHAYGIDVVDGVYNALADLDGFRRECEEGRDLGFDGKTLIHPNQVEPCNAVFSPSVDEVALARKMIAAFDLPENRGKGVVQIDGRMVERLHAEMARRTVAIAEAIGMG
ncbi:L-malyl-CoA/beta-methylmalyl-CoA lyase [Rhodovulum sp. PH10]|uniref:HpcH/HpaI aldolase/citrate lyase family protein n=1 Tax=Rhodovulum sp. PH10 TaxID=1187851 RepID=UPI00027C25FA|nr:CoA ester lyase [Rhodovulum sp. PH10]EJW13117.1 L-malyl-CoA/beta-methylmalyl-CoA lyase [Rhodovulum sp. PH10]